MADSIDSNSTHIVGFLDLPVIPKPITGLWQGGFFTFGSTLYALMIALGLLDNIRRLFGIPQPRVRCGKGTLPWMVLNMTLFLIFQGCFNWYAVVNKTEKDGFVETYPLFVYLLIICPTVTLIAAQLRHRPGVRQWVWRELEPHELDFLADEEFYCEGRRWKDAEKCWCCGRRRESEARTRKLEKAEVAAQRWNRILKVIERVRYPCGRDSAASEEATGGHASDMPKAKLEPVREA